MSIAQIAAAIGRSKATVRHRMREYGLKTRRAEQRRASIEDGGQPVHVVVWECARHGSTEFERRSGGGYRCLKCRSEAVTRRRRKVKRVLVEEAGAHVLRSATIDASRLSSFITGSPSTSGSP